MIVGCVAAVAVSVATGFALTWICVPDAGSRSSRLLFVVSLAIGMGLGVSACAFFVWMTFVGHASRSFAVADVTLSTILLASAVALGQRRSRVPAPATGARPRLWSLWAAAVSASVVAAAALFVTRSLLLPHGGWDAWMTWNLAARFLFRGESHWRDAFSPSFRHPDYPLLIPGAVARFWTYMNAETVIAPAMVAMLFTVATVALTAGGLMMLRTCRQAAIAVLLLLATSSLVTYGASQYADVPLAFFVLATVVLISLHDRAASRGRVLALAGACAALAAWTKNEGGLFLIAVLAARFVAIVRTRGWQSYLEELRSFAVGALPVLAIVAYFKVRLAPANDLVAGQNPTATLPRLLEFDRYLAVATTMASEMWRLGQNRLFGVVPLLLVYMLWMGTREDTVDRPAVVTSIVAVALLLCGYVIVLVAAPGDFLRLLNASMDRLLLHVWPTVVFTCFMVARAPEEIVL